MTISAPTENGKKVLTMAEYINRERARFEAKRYFKNMDEIQEDLDMLFCMLPAENVAPVQEWISVDDRLPEAGGYVVCIAKRNPFSRFMPIVARIEKNGWVNPMTEQYISEVTHWMPIPHPPKGE